MPAKLLFLLGVYAVISFVDIPKLKQLRSREIIAYATVTLLSVYLGIHYAFDLKWPSLEDAASVLLGGLARRIVDFLKVPS